MDTTETDKLSNILHIFIKKTKTLLKKLNQNYDNELYKNEESFFSFLKRDIIISKYCPNSISKLKRFKEK